MEERASVFFGYLKKVSLFLYGILRLESCNFDPGQVTFVTSNILEFLPAFEDIRIFIIDYERQDDQSQLSPVPKVTSPAPKVPSPAPKVPSSEPTHQPTTASVVAPPPLVPPIDEELEQEMIFLENQEFFSPSLPEFGIPDIDIEEFFGLYKN